MNNTTPMGRIVPLECRMHSRSSFEAENMAAHDAVPAVRLMPLTRQMKDSLRGQIPDDAMWAWAIVQVRRGLPDALFVGGTADSQSGAVARAQEAWRDLEEKWARERFEGKVLS